MSHSVWWKGLPGWLKIVHLLVAIPAWMFMAFCVLTGRDKSPAALVAFGAFFCAALLHIAFDRRRFGGGEEGRSGIEFGSDGGGD